MHGRIKVRTTEEERERKKKEQALKVKAYRAAMGRIQQKRQKQELDEEMLGLTTQILLRNPDVTTLWNVRRECVESIVKAKDTEEAIAAVYEAELGLTEQCLMVNPKSYGGWHHRCWTLEHSPSANWQREVQLCNKYLKMDERNFHTWDYRRYVVEKAGVPPLEELDFCTEKIKANFSNYSSWHYRSKLLPQLYPYEGDAVPKRPMSEAKLNEELEMTLTAAFTDPNDSSAWFYQRWLLGYSRADLAICAFRCDKQKAVLAFTTPVALADASLTFSDESGQQVLKLDNWVSAKQTKVDTIWLANLPDEHKLDFGGAVNYQLISNIPNLETQKLPLRSVANSFYYFCAPNRSFAYSPSVINELQSQLKSCEELLEIEPDSKWTLLTITLLMRAIDRQHYHSQCLEYLAKLQQVDSLRAGYYKDLASKWELEKALTEWENSADIPKTLNLKEMPQLCSLDYAQYFCIADEIVSTSSGDDCKDILKTFGSLAL